LRMSWSSSWPGLI